ncbi:MAG: MBL fold metallo-hydrolase [Magnetococcales bacterium]|nr:MBL fold metallo-hydrolase [Magnetococcales bacterium]
MTVLDHNLDYDKPIKLADCVYWVGFNNPNERLHSNPYLIYDGTEAILIDGGSRPDFSTVMRKILQAGVQPNQISHLIYQHYDPDLCGSIPNLEQIINRPDLKLISKKENNPFIRHYSVRSKMLCIDRIGHQLTMQSGRVLRFFPTPYAHSAGSFITYDESSGILFSSDLFGGVSESSQWKLFIELDAACGPCTDPQPRSADEACLTIQAPCVWTGLHLFHQQIIPCNKSLRYALSVIEGIQPTMIAPQHGSILYRPEDIRYAIDRLRSMNDIGIDGIFCEAGV